MTDDERWMRVALRKARAGTGATYPNPCVGAVVVRRGEQVGAGRTAPVGGPHAEVRALRQAGARARGATAYVTLEPCAHQGRTPPCTRALVAAGVRRVVVGVKDPAPHVNGRGIRSLRRAGLTVEVGVLGDRAREVHAHYLHHVEHGTPWVTLKVAASLDGRIATATGHSRWITSEPARKDGHRQRAEHHAIAVGVGTVLADDPGLDVRWVRGVDPTPIVFDTRLRGVRPGSMPRVYRSGTVVLHGPDVSARKRSALARTGAEALELPLDSGGHVDLDAAMESLGARDVRSILVEGGGRLVSSFVEGGAWQRLRLYQAPKLLGEGASWLPGLRFETVGDTPPVRVLRRRALGPDVLIELAPG